jgi:hypothetical protein
VGASVIAAFFGVTNRGKQISNLTDGDHSLNVVVTTPSTTYYLDYLDVNPTNTTIPVASGGKKNAKITIVDDSSTAITWRSNWFPGGSDWEYSRTAHGTSTPGAQVIFSFTGLILLNFVQIRHSHPFGRLIRGFVRDYRKFILANTSYYPISTR